MAQLQTIALAADRVMNALIAGLEQEFGHDAGRALADRFLQAEEIDLHWDARGSERWIGAYETQDDGVELDIVAAIGYLDGQWYSATFIVDGDGKAHGMTSCRTFPDAPSATAALARPR